MPRLRDFFDKEYRLPPDSADLRFTFTGLDGQNAEFRCSARPFFHSFQRDRSTASPRHGMQFGTTESISRGEPTGWGILGLVCLSLLHRWTGLTCTRRPQNFFWTAFVGLSSTSYSGSACSPCDSDVPFVQLVPQRVITGTDGSLAGLHNFSIDRSHPLHRQRFARQGESSSATGMQHR